MISLEELHNLSRERLEDAKVLYAAGRLKWAIYTCGYAVELALKRRICETLRWKGYPNTPAEFDQLKSFKTHDLNILLRLTGVEDQIKNGAERFTDWSVIASWNPDMRYSSQTVTNEKVKLLLEAVEILLLKKL